jgi:hypothetical protein
MISDDQVIVGGDTAETGSDRLTSVFLPVTAPRIHSPLNDLPSRGFELIDFADQILPDGFMPWQKWLAEHSLQGKTGWPLLSPGHRWTCLQGKTERAHTCWRGLQWGYSIGMNRFRFPSAHRLVTSLEQFRQPLCNDRKMHDLANQVNAFAGNMEPKKSKPLKAIDLSSKLAAAARGLSKPEKVHIDELP